MELLGFTGCRCLSIGRADRGRSIHRSYRATGRVFRDADALFSKTNWLAVMHGQGLQAVGHDPLADALSLDEASVRLARMAMVTAAAAARMPAHHEFITRNCAALKNS